MSMARTNTDTEAAEDSLGPGQMLDLLIEHDVLNDTPMGVTATTGFVAQMEEKRNSVTSLTTDERSQRVQRIADSPEQANVVTEAVSDNPEFLATLLTLADVVPDVSTETLVHAAPQLQQFGDRPARSDGAPNRFVPIRGDQIATVTGLFPRSILYVWLDDCEECDMLKQTFNSLFAQKPDGIELFAVYGPEWAEQLHSEYEIKGGPVVAYLTRDEIDTRMYGAMDKSIYEKEVAELRKTPLP